MTRAPRLALALLALGTPILALATSAEDRGISEDRNIVDVTGETARDAKVATEANRHQLMVREENKPNSDPFVAPLPEHDDFRVRAHDPSTPPGQALIVGGDVNVIIYDPGTGEQLIGEQFHEGPSGEDAVELPDFLGKTLDAALKEAGEDLPGWPVLAVDTSLTPQAGSQKRIVVWQVPPPGKFVAVNTPVTFVVGGVLDDISVTQPILDVTDKWVASAKYRTLLNGHVLRVREQGSTGPYQMPTFQQILTYSVIAHDPGSKPGTHRGIGGNVDVIIDEAGLTGDIKNTAGGSTIEIRQVLIAVLLALAAGLAAGLFLAKLLNRG